MTESDFEDVMAALRDGQHFQIGGGRIFPTYAMKNGQVTVINNKLVPGPFSLNARQMILDRLLETQQECGERLISDVEIETIRRFWAEDLIRMHTKQGEQ